MKVEGYEGICRICFFPVEEGAVVKLRDGGWPFHHKCTEENPNSYYLALERIRVHFEKGFNPTKLMNDMEQIFKIPALNDEKFNEDNPDVIELYRQISDSRAL